jgi:hypothetical protein
MLNDRTTTFFDAYIESIRRYKKQLSRMEYYFEARKPSISASTSLPASAPAMPFFLNQWKANAAANLFKFKSVPSAQFDDD